MIGAEDVRVVLLSLSTSISTTPSAPAFRAAGSGLSRMFESAISSPGDRPSSNSVAANRREVAFARVLFLKGYSRFSATAVKNGASADVGEVPLNNWTPRQLARS